MNKSCAGPPTRNQVSSASDWFARSRPRSSGIFDFRAGTRSGKLTLRPPRSNRASATERAGPQLLWHCRKSSPACADRGDRCRLCRVRRCDRRASAPDAPALFPDEIATRVAMAGVKMPGLEQAAVEASFSHPAGRSQLSPCQCSTGVVPSGASADALPPSVNVSGAKPISLTGPGATRAPSAAAIICAPRQMPSIGLSASSRVLIAATSSLING